jgi:viroplasmin and RNaseH domain-containing protein
MNQKEIIEQLTVFVDEYHALSQPSELAALWRIRKDITERLFALSKLTHNTYGKKALNHLMRKYMISKEIAIALEKDRKAGGKARSMASLETETRSIEFYS